MREFFTLGQNIAVARKNTSGARNLRLTSNWRPSPAAKQTEDVGLPRSKTQSGAARIFFPPGSAMDFLHELRPTGLSLRGRFLFQLFI